jgi:hypothetical protein
MKDDFLMWTGLMTKKKNKNNKDIVNEQSPHKEEITDTAPYSITSEAGAIKRSSSEELDVTEWEEVEPGVPEQSYVQLIASGAKTGLKTFGKAAAVTGSSLQAGSETLANGIVTTVNSPSQALKIVESRATSTQYHKRGGDYHKYFKANVDKNPVTEHLQQIDPNNKPEETKFLYRYSTTMGRVTKTDTYGSYIESVGDNVVSYAMSSLKQQEQSQSLL